MPDAKSEIRIGNWPALVPLALAGFLLALFGTYWDDAWHTDKGRDSFLAAPHIALYAGISLTGAALSAWAFLSARRVGIRAALGHPPLAIASVGVLATLGGAPVDNFWHEAFGRDAVIWSPPHMLGVAGTLAIAAGLLLELAPQAHTRGTVLAALVAAAAVVAVGAIPVLEYETDVPQFDEALYLPVLATGIAFSLGLARLALALRWAAGAVALAYTAIMILIATILALAEMPAPLVPLVVVPAIVLDLTAGRLGRPLVAALFTASLFAVYVPYLNWIKSDLFLDLGELVVGLPLAFVGSLIALTITASPRSRSSRGGGLAGGVAALLLLLPGSALGHDPGQGEELTTAAVTARATGDTGSLTVDLAGSGHCADVAPVRLTARRAGDTVTAPLRPRGQCGFSGSLSLPERGRWFLYGELQHRGDALEVWLPIHSGERETVTDDARSVYRPPTVENPPLKVAAGIAIYLVLAVIVAGVPPLYRRALDRTSGAGGPRRIG